MIDVSTVEQDWKARGFSFGVWTDPPGQQWEGYVHEYDELFMVLDGEFELSVCGQTRIAAVGEEILIPARESHSVRNVGGRTGQWLYGYAGPVDA